jgi:hypothetical protein
MKSGNVEMLGQRSTRKECRGSKELAPSATPTKEDLMDMTIGTYIYVCHDLTDCTSSIGQKEDALASPAPFTLPTSRTIGFAAQRM